MSTEEVVEIIARGLCPGDPDRIVHLGAMSTGRSQGDGAPPTSNAIILKCKAWQQYEVQARAVLKALEERGMVHTFDTEFHDFAGGLRIKPGTYIMIRTERQPEPGF